MHYYFSRTIQTTFSDALSRAVEELQKEGLSVQPDIDDACSLREQLDNEYEYRILAVRDPAFSYEPLQQEEIPPWSVIVQEIPGVGAEIGAVDPVAALQNVGNPALEKVAAQVRGKIRKALDRTV